MALQYQPLKNSKKWMQSYKEWGRYLEKYSSSYLNMTAILGWI